MKKIQDIWDRDVIGPTRQQLIQKMSNDPRIQSGKRQIGPFGDPGPERQMEIHAAAADRQLDLARAAGFRMRSSLREMARDLYQHVFLKCLRQAHEAELAEPGDPPTRGIIGTPEW